MSKSYTTKITVRACGIDPATCEKVVEKFKKESAILHVVGRAAGIEYRTGDLGQYATFSGEFAAVNLITGDQYRAKKLILPAVAEQLLSDALLALRKAEESDSASLEFRLQITVAPNPAAATRGGHTFKYGVKSEKSATKDALDKLLEESGAPEYLSLTDARKKANK